MSVTVVSCVYGGMYGAFRPRWESAIAALDPEPDAVLVMTDEWHKSTWKHPQAYFQQLAISKVKTDWVWLLDIDDIAMPDALAGLEDVDADVWQMGFHRSDGEEYVPPQLSAAEFLASDRNVFVGGSCIRVDAFRACGGFDDVALQDWSLWRKLALNGATFQSSGRTHFHYMRHPYTRGELELTMDARPLHMAEMEAHLVAA